ncbi:AGAP011080-PA-like protein [Anopheles sinensis]|uniref:hydroxymethylbilane synthase n=1 Tax=Anopheles sinensis TaxID=74873 RepID=A0A084WLV2_ANOSI|nr:AGAP011080-PA-like protein [Anopheles sinensis]
MGADQERAKKTIRVGSRKSELALTQTKHVIALLQKLNPDVVYEIHTMTTVGDRVLNKSLPKIGEKSLFTKDLEDALRTGGVDFVVHSLKDLPTALPVGMAIGAVLEREDPRDALVLNERHRGCTLATLPKGSVVGTSSLRRSAQLARYYSHLGVCDIRGNLNTRLAKLDADASKFAGIVLAQAGLVRMGWHKRIDQIIEPHEILYAVGQGALAVECRSNDDYILTMLAKLCHLETQCRILTERSFLKTLGGGCSAPVAVRTELKLAQETANGRKRASSGSDDGETFQLHVQGAVWSLDGKTEIRSEGECVLNLGESRPKSPRLDGRSSDDETPAAKKAKPSSGGSSPESGRVCPIDHHQQRKKSPEIIADTDELLLLPGCSKDGGARLDLNKFIDIHGELFKKCPYSSELTKLAKEAKQAGVDRNELEDEKGEGEKEQEEHEEKSQTTEQEKGKSETDGCPSSRFPVGQEVMGDCPFVSTEEKVDLGGSLSVGLVCPVTGRKQENGSQKNGTSAETTTEPGTAPLADKCPFLAAKVLDYNEHLDRRQIAEPTLEDNSEQLFCGMHRHSFIERAVFERCEKLGYDLAHDLITKGALAVMKCAQNEIHSKIA